MKTIDEGIEILTGIPSEAGSGIESVYQAAARRLKEFAVGLKEFAAPSPNGALESKA